MPGVVESNSVLDGWGTRFNGLMTFSTIGLASYHRLKSAFSSHAAEFRKIVNKTGLFSIRFISLDLARKTQKFFQHNECLPIATMQKWKSKMKSMSSPAMSKTTSKE